MKGIEQCATLTYITEEQTKQKDIPQNTKHLPTPQAPHVPAQQENTNNIQHIIISQRLQFHKIQIDD